MNRWRLAGHATTIVVMFFLFFAALDYYKLHQFTKLHPGQRYEWQVYAPPPEELQVKIGYTESVKNWVLLGALLMIAIQFFDYKARPEIHWLSSIRQWFESKKLERYADMLEVDEDDQETFK